MNTKLVGIGVFLCALTSAGCPLVPNPNPLAEEGETGANEEPCSPLPMGAVGATYSYSPNFPADGAPYSNWNATGLPDGLTIDPTTGEISGVPTAVSTSPGVTISATSDATMATIEHECGPLSVSSALSALRVKDEPSHCLPVTFDYEDLLALLDGGDGTEVHCIAPSPSDDPTSTCRLGDGNGRFPPGLSFDEETCTYSGEISSTRRGTWVWMMSIEQSGYTTAVPICATNDVDTYHDISVLADGSPASDLQPPFFEYDPNEDLHFGGGSHQWEIANPNCPDSDCDFYGFRFNVTCSPFDVTDPWQVSLSPSQKTETGFTHEMTVSGPKPDPKFDGRAFVSSFEMSYCTADNDAQCDTDDAKFEANAQTKYHVDILAYPTL